VTSLSGWSLRRPGPAQRQSAVLSVLVVCALLVSAGHAVAAPSPLANPQANRPMPPLANSTGLCTYGQGGGLSCQSPCYPTGALQYNSSHGCTDLLLAAINQAQAAQHLKGFTLPSNYFRLNATRQLFVLVNLARISLGVPPIVGLSPYLSAASTAAARQAEDPSFQSSYGPVQVWLPPTGGTYAIGGAWAGDAVNAAAALFGWFYDDGWGGSKATWNFDCTSPVASGCWGHRDELLGEWAGTGCTDCVAGAGYASPAAGDWKESYDFLLVRPVQFPTPLTFTWDGDVIPYLPPGWETVRAA
jgi:hypothetical protein